MANSPKQLVEGWCALARSNVLLYYIEFAVSENICSQNYPSKFPQLEFSRIVFQGNGSTAQVLFGLLEGCLLFGLTTQLLCGFYFQLCRGDR